MTSFALFACAWLAVLLSAQGVSAQLNKGTPEVLQDLTVTEYLGDTVPLKTRFATSSGDSVYLYEILEEGKPVLLNPLYYDCPMLCGLVIEGVFQSIDELTWKPGKEYTVISYSIDPTENDSVASVYKEQFLSDLSTPINPDGWYFLTGNKININKLSEAIGFGFTEIQGTGEYAHPAAIVMLSPKGVITRYLYGVQFDEFVVRSALYESADGKIGNTMTKVLMYCYQYDPESNSYVPIAINIMKLGGLATLIILGIFL
ncbi:MAG: SCO family protein, partial [Bacteroidota bacterium]